MLVVIVFFALLVTIIRAIAGFQAFHLASQLDEAVRDYYFAFLLFNLFFIYTIGGSFFLKIDNFLSANLSTFIQLLAQSIPTQAFFFTNYVVTNCALSLSLLLVRPAALVLYHVKRRFLAKTETDLKELDNPPPYDFVPIYARLSLMVVICLTYSTMFPLILLFGAIYFFYTYIIERYEHSLFIYIYFAISIYTQPRICSEILTRFSAFFCTHISYNSSHAPIIYFYARLQISNWFSICSYNILYVYGPAKEGFGNMYPGAFGFITVALLVFQITVCCFSFVSLSICAYLTVV